MECLSKKWPYGRSLILKRCCGTDRRIWVENLEKTFQVSDWKMEEISSYCPYLRHLYIDRQRVVWSGVEEDTFWRKVGKHLETLCISTIERIQQARLIKDHCRKIKSLDLSGRGGQENGEISKSIASYGRHLGNTELKNKSETQMRRVKRACPNSRLDLSIDYGLLGPAIIILGDKLEDIQASMEYDSSEAADLPRNRSQIYRNWRLAGFIIANILSFLVIFDY